MQLSAKFSVRESTRGVLFMPECEEAKALCFVARRKNLTLCDIENYIRMGAHIIVVPSIPMNKQLLDKVEFRPLEYVFDETKTVVKK